MKVPDGWKAALNQELAKPYVHDLEEFVAHERTRHEVYPPASQVFSALELTPLESVRVLLLGQDPYHGPGQAHGLCFSVLPGTKLPPSLKNIFRELHEDVGCPTPNHGCLTHWARQGVLLLNTVLTVRAGEANSHRGRGWESFTDAIIRTVSRQLRGVVFVLWGRPAQQKRRLIDQQRHAILESAHPSPLSAHRGFFGSRPFSEINRRLQNAGQPKIDWCLPQEG